MAKFILAILMSSAATLAHSQHLLTITPVSSLPAVPVQNVSRQSLSLVPGTQEADPTPVRPVYDPKNVTAYSGRESRHPVPVFNATSVSFCEVSLIGID